METLKERQVDRYRYVSILLIRINTSAKTNTSVTAVNAIGQIFLGQSSAACFPLSFLLRAFRDRLGPLAHQRAQNLAKKQEYFF